ncbi:MAG: hypothetical protein GWO24_19215 [Akkermansiaceae bacterium]|nr:hypothetical protein [Akkermansiaceae bacterium]
MERNQQDPLSKTQMVRLADVFIIGPLMIWGGMNVKRDGLGTLLTLAGVGTILFNGLNFIRLEEMKKRRRVREATP